MEEETRKQLDAHGELLGKIYVSTEKTRKYFLWTLIFSLVVFILPFIGLLFVIPRFLNIYSAGLNGL